MALGDSATATATPSVAKLSITGAALAALLHSCAAAAGDCDGLLFGRAAHLPMPPAALSDYDDAAPPAPALSISVFGHCSLSHPSSLSDSLSHCPLCPLSQSLPPRFLLSSLLPTWTFPIPSSSQI